MRLGRAAVGSVWMAGFLLLVSAASAERLVVATYNVQNYLSTDRPVDGVYTRDHPKPESEKAALRAVIRTMDADLIAFQEMGTLSYLKELQRDLTREGLEYPYAEVLDAADVDRHLAVLAKRPLVQVVRHTDLDFKYRDRNEPVKRGLLEVQVGTAAGPVAVFVVHLKSRFTDHSDDPQSARRRAGEATAIRDRVLQRFPSPDRSLFLLVGDCNDSPGSRPLRALTARGERVIAVPVPAVDSRGETWTHFYRKEESYSRVDYILASPGLRPFIEHGRARILDLPEVRESSDHRPVLVTLDLPESAPTFAPEKRTAR